MIAFDIKYPIDDPLIHCNVEECVAGRMFWIRTEAVNENCNIIRNKQLSDFTHLINNECRIVLKRCVHAQCLKTPREV